MLCIKALQQPNSILGSTIACRQLGVQLNLGNSRLPSRLAALLDLFCKRGCRRVLIIR